MAKKKPAPKRESTKRPKETAKKPAAKDNIAPSPADEPQSVGDGELPFPIIGIGASAGGLDAFTQMLQALPPAPGLALVFVQHLSPSHSSALTTLLSGATSLEVEEVTEGIEIEANHVYVVPPNVQMELRGRALHLVPRPDDHTQFTPIDFFFRSLARELQAGAVGVVLSGTASDGANGLREIKAAGGIALAQEPKSAKYDGMPQAAVGTGVVDLALPPDELAHELLRIVRHPNVRRAKPPREDDVPVDDEKLSRIFDLLRATSGVDFTHYKSPTIKRRLQRRMVLHKIPNLDQYVKLLEENPGEVEQLYHDVLIHVTKFFREPDSFAALAQHVFPKLLEGRTNEHPIRIWVPGCSTGEEPYSVAIALLEFMGDRAGAVPVQVFATDVSEIAIEVARAGVYPPTIADDVSEERLRRFFTKMDGHYRIAKNVRDMCVFARQDLTRDPPFSKLDVIVCRNVLIYLGPVLQKKLISIFHYALKNDGALVLGSAETTGPFSEMFQVVEKKHRLYCKRHVEQMPGPVPTFDYAAGRAERSSRTQLEPRTTGNVHNEANRLILDKYGPTAVIVDQDMQIVQFRGHTGRFLEPAPGDASLNVLKMARDGLLYGLRSALHAARRRQTAVRRDGLRLKHNGHLLEVNIEVTPLQPSGEKRHFLVVFEQVSTSQEAAADAKTKKKGKAPADAADQDDGHAEIDRLQQELAASRDYLQSIIQDLEAANEELQSANEEILSSNEELQSTNEELDTAKEELQSTNEELNTVNEELHGRNEELSRVNSDLVNLLASVQIAIVIVSADLRIRRFTPMAEKVLNLIPGDVGRPISQIKPNIDCPQLEQMLHESIENIAVQQCDVQDAQGRWFSLTVRPYKNVDNRIDGAVLTLFDMNEMRQKELAVRDAAEYAEAVIETMHEPLVVLDGDLRVRKVNKGYYRTFPVSPPNTEGKSIYELGHGCWNIPQLRELLESVLATNGTFEDVPISCEFPKLGRRDLRFNGRRIPAGNPNVPPKLILVAIEDVTGRA